MPNIWHEKYVTQIDTKIITPKKKKKIDVSGTKVSAPRDVSPEESHVLGIHSGFLKIKSDLSLGGWVQGKQVDMGDSILGSQNRIRKGIQCEVT